jgi:hypothetical protein
MDICATIPAQSNESIPKGEELLYYLQQCSGPKPHVSERVELHSD